MGLTISMALSDVRLGHVSNSAFMIMQRISVQDYMENINY
jgi:hypothetical protein